MIKSNKHKGGGGEWMQGEAICMQLNSSLYKKIVRDILYNMEKISITGEYIMYDVYININKEWGV